MSPSSAAPPSRLDAIDWIKASAIVAVVIAHSLVLWFARPPALDNFFQAATNFCVPAFLVASGVLHARRGRLGWPAFRDQLARLVVPYLVASTVAQLTRLADARTGTVLFQFATGSSLLIYYYVLLLVECLLLTRMIERLNPYATEVGLGLLCLYGVATSLRPATRPEDFFWLVRNPLHFYGYFLTGVVAWRHRSVLAALRERALPAAAACVLGIVVYATLARRASDLGGPLRALYSISMIGLIALVADGREPPTAVRFLSRATYTIYLYHFFFVSCVHASTEAWPSALRIAARTGAGLGGATLVCILGARLLGKRARLLLGV